MDDETPKSSHLNEPTPLNLCKKRRSLYEILDNQDVQSSLVTNPSYGEELSKEFSEWLAIIKNKGKKVYNLPNEFNILKAPKNLDDIQLTPDMQRYLNSKVDVEKFFKDSEAFRKDVELFKDIHNALMDQFDQKRREIGYMVNRKINNIVNSNICDN